MSLGMASSGHRRGGAGFGGGEGGSGVELVLVKVGQGTGIMGILGIPDGMCYFKLYLS